MTDVIPGTVWRVRVTVLPRAGVNDPAGDSIRGGLAQLGYGGVVAVRAGKLITLDVVAADADAARDATGRMCEQLLANPVIERFEIDVVGVVGAGDGR